MPGCATIARINWGPLTTTLRMVFVPTRPVVVWGIHWLALFIPAAPHNNRRSLIGVINQVVTDANGVVIRLVEHVIEEEVNGYSILRTWEAENKGRFLCKN